MDKKSSYYRELDRQYLWHPYSKRSAIENEDFPVIVRGEDIYLFDADEKRYLDAVSSWWACSLGHNNPRLIDAMCRQARELQHSILGNLSHVRAIELGQKIVKLFHTGKRRVFFSSDGASAVEAALKIAVQYWYNKGNPQKNKFVSLKEDYHGDTLGAVSVGYVESFHQLFKQLLFPVFRADSPCCGLCGFGTPDSCNLECFESMEQIIESHSHEIAAVIIEPLCQAAGGMRIYSAKYLKRLYDLCRQKDILFISDEIAMGFGRTGKMFAFEHAGIDSDIVCIGKALSSGYLPISATVVKDPIYQTFSDSTTDNTFYHGHTFGGNPIAAAVALQVLDIYKEADIIGRANTLAAVLKTEFEKFKDLSIVRHVRCLGMIGVVELNDGESNEAEALAQNVRRRLLEREILIRPLGPILYIMPPLIISEDTLCNLITEFYQALRQVEEKG